MNTRQYSNRHEKSVAKATGGKRQANSGATPFRKGDVISGPVLIECKTQITEKQSVSISRAWIEKNREEAFAMGKRYSAIAFNFLQNGENFYIIDEQMFIRLLEVLKEDE